MPIFFISINQLVEWAGIHTDTRSVNKCLHIVGIYISFLPGYVGTDKAVEICGSSTFNVDLSIEPAGLAIM